MHAEHGGKARIACGTIKPVPSLYVEKLLQYVEGAGFSRYVFISNPKCTTWCCLRKPTSQSGLQKGPQLKPKLN